MSCSGSEDYQPAKCAHKYAYQLTVLREDLYPSTHPQIGTDHEHMVKLCDLLLSTFKDDATLVEALSSITYLMIFVTRLRHYEANSHIARQHAVVVRSWTDMLEQVRSDLKEKKLSREAVAALSKLTRADASKPGSRSGEHASDGYLALTAVVAESDHTEPELPPILDHHHPCESERINIGTGSLPLTVGEKQRQVSERQQRRRSQGHHEGESAATATLQGQTESEQQEEGEAERKNSDDEQNEQQQIEQSCKQSCESAESGAPTAKRLVIVNRSAKGTPSGAMNTQSSQEFEVSSRKVQNKVPGHKQPSSPIGSSQHRQSGSSDTSEIPTSLRRRHDHASKSTETMPTLDQEVDEENATVARVGEKSQKKKQKRLNISVQEEEEDEDEEEEEGEEQEEEEEEGKEAEEDDDDGEKDNDEEDENDDTSEGRNDGHESFEAHTSSGKQSPDVIASERKKIDGNSAVTAKETGHDKRIGKSVSLFASQQHQEEEGQTPDNSERNEKPKRPRSWESDQLSDSDPQSNGDEDISSSRKRRKTSPIGDLQLSSSWISLVNDSALRALVEAPLCHAIQEFDRPDMVERSIDYVQQFVSSRELALDQHGKFAPKTIHALRLVLQPLSQDSVARSSDAWTNVFAPTSTVVSDVTKALDQQIANAQQVPYDLKEAVRFLRTSRTYDIASLAAPMQRNINLVWFQRHLNKVIKDLKSRFRDAECPPVKAVAELEENLLRMGCKEKLKFKGKQRCWKSVARSFSITLAQWLFGSENSFQATRWSNTQSLIRTLFIMIEEWGEGVLCLHLESLPRLSHSCDKKLLRDLCKWMATIRPVKRFCKVLEDNLLDGFENLQANHTQDRLDLTQASDMSATRIEALKKLIQRGYGYHDISQALSTPSNHSFSYPRIATLSPTPSHDVANPHVAALLD